MSVGVSGFTFVRDAIRGDYPVVESIQSILPIVDEFVVNVGRSSDDTLELIRSIDSPKLRVIESEWNPHTRSGGFVYAQQTNIALFNCRGAWAFYLQSDEVVHEDDLPHLDETMQRHRDDPDVEALALERLNFWGDYQTQAIVPWLDPWTCRVVKPHHFLLSRGDAAGFTVHPKYKERGRQPRTLRTQARKFHYPGLKSFSALSAKREVEIEVWGERALSEHDATGEAHYTAIPRSFVAEFSGTHPAVMSERIENYPMRLDLGSPLWRTKLTAKERRRLRKHRISELFRGGVIDGLLGRKAG